MEKNHFSVIYSHEFCLSKHSNLIQFDTEDYAPMSKIK